MEWIDLYGPDQQPAPEQISEYISNPLWENLNAFLRENYDTEPKYSFSSCAGQPGWNVKYQKAGRSLCTLYPMPGAFIALVVIGAKEEAEAGLLAPTLTEYTQNLMGSAAALMGARWLMIHVTDEAVLGDVKRLIQVRRKVKKKTA